MLLLLDLVISFFLSRVLNFKSTQMCSLKKQIRKKKLRQTLFEKNH